MKNNQSQKTIVSHGYTLTNPNGPASVGQKIQLHYLTGKDTRNSKLTKLEASELIHTLGEAKKNRAPKQSGATISAASLAKLGIRIVK